MITIYSKFPGYRWMKRTQVHSLEEAKEYCVALQKALPHIQTRMEGYIG